MAISYPLTPPVEFQPAKFTWSPRSAVAFQESPFSFVQKTYDWGGKSRSAVLKYPALTIDKARVAKGFTLSLNGLAGTFYMNDPSAGYLRGTVPDQYTLGRVNGANQTGTSLVTDGWPAGGTLLVGDWLSIGDRLYEILTDVIADGGGAASLDLWPSVRLSPADNAVIRVGSDSRGIFRLMSFPESEMDVDWFTNGFSLNILEALTT